MMSLKPWPNKKITKYLIELTPANRQNSDICIKTRCLFPIFKSANYLIKKNNRCVDLKTDVIIDYETILDREIIISQKNMYYWIYQEIIKYDHSDFLHLFKFNKEHFVILNHPDVLLLIEQQLKYPWREQLVYLEKHNDFWGEDHTLDYFRHVYDQTDYVRKYNWATSII